MKNVSLDVKQWAILDAKNNKILNLNHEEFKNFMQDFPVKLKGDFVSVNQYRNANKIWIDAIVNSEHLK